METQKQKIKDMLLKDGQVSNYRLLELYMPRYAARIHELNKEGMGIRFMPTPTPQKKKLGIYYITKN